MEATWLKSVFQETEIDQPQPKRVKFSELSSELHAHFPEKTYSAYELSRLVHQVFPHTESKACGKSRQKHLMGLERIPPESSTSEVKCTSSLGASYSDLLLENQQLKDQIQELERTSVTSLCCQADKVISRKSTVTQGPNSIDSFQQLDFDTIVAELQSHAPDLYNLYMTLGDTTRNREDVSSEEVKVVASMCSLLNARSARVKGLQLLVSMMLVARATNRQVQK